MAGDFLAFWESQGGLPIFGYPLTNAQPITGATGTATVQTFERARMEQRGKGPITLALLDTMVHPPDPAVPPRTGARYFPATGHNLGSGFREFWETHGGLAAAGAAQAAALISVTNAPELVLAVCRQAKAQFGIPVLIANLDDLRYTRQLTALDVRLVQPATATALALEGALRFPAAFHMLTERGDGVDLAEAHLANAALVGRALRQVRLPGTVLVLGIRRQGEVVIPHGDTSLLGGDILMLVGQSDDLRAACGLIEGRAIPAPGLPQRPRAWLGWTARRHRATNRVTPPF